jgi:4-amino-4-deoxy-L-arabinose transferase-like glycosyltransferase
MMKLPPSLWGGLFGALLGVVILYPPFLIVVVLGAFGYLVGKVWESEELRTKIRELLSMFFR